MPTQTLSITTSDGHTLDGALEMPTGLVRGAAIFAHCFTCTKQSRAAISVARSLARRGIACLRFDFTGLGGSEGEFGRAGFATDISDLVAVAGALRERFDTRLLLVGHSLGGAAVLAAAHELGAKNVAAVATIGAPSDVPHVLHNIKGDHDAIRVDGEGPVKIGGQSFSLSREFLERTEAVDLLDLVKEIRLPYLAMHAPTDTIVGIEHAGALFSAAFHPKSFVSLDNADHLLTRKEDAEYAAETIAAWAERYLPLSADWPTPESGVIVRTGHGKFATEVHTPNMRFLADEPISFGGEASGPTPYNLLNAALGTCTAMTMKMYADRKEWPLEGVIVEVKHEREHGKDCDHCEEEGEGAKVQAMHRRIEIKGDELSDDQRSRILAIADRCPVHLTLEGHLHVHTESAD
ncbi:MAG: bifunctional alpha/beta hydrolase/OsmC family protein [Erythrobacter sp.]